jgi:DNA-binding PadR family transcriptional regulator
LEELRGTTLDKLTEMLKGVLEGCMLEIISRGATYGYEITRRLNALGFTDVVDGTTYTILLRLEKNGLVDTYRQPSDLGPPRKFFTLDDAGREELRRFWTRWEFVASKLCQLKDEQLKDYQLKDEQLEVDQLKEEQQHV